MIETTLDGEVLVGSSRERTGFDTASTPRSPRALLEARPRSCPASRSLEVRRRVGRPAPLAARRAARRSGARATGIWVATGHEGAGVGLGPITGELIAAAISGEPPPLDLAPFDPDRFAQTERATAPRPPATRG